MAERALVFYEKPGCINNRRQKGILQDAGFQLDVRNLLQTPWTPAELRTYFGEQPVAAWFNPSAPAVKAGQINPDTIAADTALRAMCEDPLLIRRPLLRWQHGRMAGFDFEKLLAQWQITATPVAAERLHNIEVCSKA